VNREETQASIDAALTFGILWLDACRQAEAGRTLVEGLKLFLPAGTSALTRERMAQLDRAAAKWQLCEFDERHDDLAEVDCADRGNIATRLVRCADKTAALERFAASVQRVLALLPECEVAVLARQRLHSAGSGWNSRGHGSPTSPMGSGTDRKSSTALALRSVYSTTQVVENSLRW
jgi:hypothetical protein